MFDKLAFACYDIKRNLAIKTLSKVKNSLLKNLSLKCIGNPKKLMILRSIPIQKYKMKFCDGEFDPGSE